MSRVKVLLVLGLLVVMVHCHYHKQKANHEQRSERLVSVRVIQKFKQMESMNLTFEMNQSISEQRTMILQRYLERNKNENHYKLYYSKLKFYQQMEYQIPIQFGEDRKNTFYVVLDSGSSDLWLPDEVNDGFWRGIRGYRCDQRDCKKSNESLQINYGDGPIKGRISFTDILIDEQIPIKNQSFGLIYYARSNMGGTPGIFGIGPPELAMSSYPQPLEHMITLGLIDRYMFSLFLDVQAQKSQIVFGGHDPKFMRNRSEPILYSKIVSNYSYTIGISGFSIGGEFVDQGKALIDSGTTCLTFPELEIQFVVDVMRAHGIECRFFQEEGAPQYSVLNCKGDLSKYPNITIHLNSNSKLVLNPEDYIFYCEKHAQDQHPYCYTMIESSRYDEKIILGDGFLQKFYTIFDFENHQIGFAPSISNHTIHIYTQAKEQKNQNMFLEVLTNETTTSSDPLRQSLGLKRNHLFVIFLLSLTYVAIFTLFHRQLSQKQIDDALFLKKFGIVSAIWISTIIIYLSYLDNFF